MPPIVPKTQVAERFHPPASDVTARMEELMEKRSLAGGVAAGRVPGEQRCKAIAEVGWLEVNAAPS